MNNGKKLIWIKYYLPSYLYAGLIFTLSSYSLNLPPSTPHFTDKFVHMAEYGVFGLLLARSYFNATAKFYKKYFIIWALFTGMLCGVLDEYYQSFVPGRFFEYLDMASDAVGILAGSLIFSLRTLYRD